MSTVTITQHEEELARELVARAPDPRFTALSGGKRVEVHDALSALLRKVLKAVADGGTVTLRTLPNELSTTVAADLLGVSRPTLMRMIREGDIPAHRVGTHHRLKLPDVLEFGRARLQSQRAAFEELRQLEGDMGVD